VSLGDRRRRTRRTFLLLSAILIPTVVVVLLVVRVVHQETELAERRASEERRDALDQLRRELSARLQAVRLEEVNRLIGESGTRVPPDSPIVFVAPMAQDRLILPWEDTGNRRPPSVGFSALQARGETLEFQVRNARAAVDVYHLAREAARTPFEGCAASLALGRAERAAAMAEAADSTDRATMRECANVSDEDGIPFGLYAAQRLVERAPDSEVADLLLRRVGTSGWRSPHEAYALQALFQHLPADVATEPQRRLVNEIHDIEQITALAGELQNHPNKLRGASPSARGDLPWMGFGDEPWLVTLVSPTSFAAPVVMAVSSRRIMTSGVYLRVPRSPVTASSLGDDFLDLEADWPAARFTPPTSTSVVLYGSILAMVLGTALFAGYLVLRDVHREAATAEMRATFVASVSHELKTPLTSIRAHAETLLMGRTRGPETTSEYLSAIVNESERLSRLVDSVLEFSRIEQGRRTYQMRATRLGDVARSAARTMEYPLAQFGFTLTVSSDEREPMLSGDPEALTQALLNLLSNAMKYSGEARQIEMRSGTRDNEAFVDVVDHGIGIPREERVRIFERFHRVRSSETQGIAGAGLGLALALHVVEAHQGRIVVSSDVGRGSTFSVRIPLQGQA
jgi:signal transduction histidine kinase